MSAAIDESPGRILAIAEAKTIEADVEGYRARLAEDARKTGVWLSRPSPGELVDDQAEPSTRRLTSKLSAGDAVEGEAMVEDLADLIARHGDHGDGNQGDGDDGDAPTRDQLRAQAFALLVTNPHAAAALLDGADAPPSPEDEDRAAVPVPVKKRRPATILVHLTDAVLSGHLPGVARVEGMGPMLLEQVADLLGHRAVTVQPVIDLNHARSVNAYEHPTAVKLRTRLRTVYDVFPHSTSRATSRLDHDQPAPYDPGGPPGQTGDHNNAPLTRYHHRAKTHHGYALRQLGLGAYRWTSPRGLARLVTPAGTRKVDLLRARDGTIAGEIHPAVAIDWPSGQPCGVDHAQRLEAERDRTLSRLASLSEDFDAIVAASRDTNADDEHDPEGATIAFERSQVGALVRQARDHLLEVDAAVARLEAGTYGVCEECGGPIAEERLEVRPLARTCIRCASPSRR